MSSIKTLDFGGKGGSHEFGPILAGPGLKLGLHAGNRIDQIVLNDKQYGGDGGHSQGAITLTGDEYISALTVHAGDEIDHLSFQTSEGHTIAGGDGGGGHTRVQLENIRLLSISGRHGDRVDNLSLTYVEGYSKSNCVGTGKFLLGIIPQGHTYSTSTSSTVRRLRLYKEVTQHMIGQKYSASVQGEYYVQASASTELTVSDSTLKELQSEIETTISNTTEESQQIDGGKVGLHVVDGQIMKNGDAYWMYPTGDLQTLVVPVSETAAGRGLYDMTGVLDVQMTGLQRFRTSQYGWTYYTPRKA